MCGRFALGIPHTQIQQLEDYPDLQSQVGGWVNRDDFVPRYNIAPRTQAPVIYRAATDQTQTSPGDKPLVLHTMKWSLVPHWSKTEESTSKLTTFNARAETLQESGRAGMWGSIKGKKRCIVPAQGYYEWLQKGKERVPHFTRHRDGKLTLFAGLYDVAELEGRSEPLWTFTIVTTPAPRAFEWLHDRQPVILSDTEDIDLWLDTSSGVWTSTLNRLLDPYKDAGERLECYAVPKEVGKIGTESPSFIQPVSKRKDGIEAMFAKQTAKPISSSDIKRKRSSTPEIKLSETREGDGAVVKVESGDVEAMPSSSQPSSSQPSASQERKAKRAKVESPRKAAKDAKKAEGSRKITSFFKQS